MGRRGFVDTGILMQGVGVAAGLIAAPALTRAVPANITTALGGYGVPAVKIAAGLAAAYLLRKQSPTLATALALGMVGSGAIDVYNKLNPSGAIGGYDLIESGVGEYGDPGTDGNTYILADGTAVNGYELTSGEVVDGMGNLIANAADASDDA